MVTYEWRERTLFERFTERARQVVILAQEEARTGPYDYINEVHLLLGILREEEGLAARVLASFDVTVEQARDAMKLTMETTEKIDGGQIPFTPETKAVLEMALREALSLGHNYIGTEHVLLGLVRERQQGQTNKAVALLRDGFNLRAETIRNEVIRMLSGPSGRRQRPPEPDVAESHEYPLYRTKGEEIAAKRAEADRARYGGGAEEATQQVDPLMQVATTLSGILQAQTAIMDRLVDQRVPETPTAGLARFLNAWNDLVRVLPDEVPEATSKSVHDAIMALDTAIQRTQRPRGDEDA